jgi:putative ABC transport system permease protein
MIKDFFIIALNNLRRRRLRSWLTMLGIFIGIAAVVSLISLGQGLQTAITGQLGTLSTDKLTVQNSGTGFGPPGSTVVKKLNEHDVKVIESVRGVEYVIPRLIRNGRVEYNKVANFHYLASVPEDSQERDIVYDSAELKIDKGKLLESGDSGSIVLGSDIAKEDNFDKKIDIGKSLRVQGREFEVVGILKKASTFTINSAILMMERDLEEILDIEGEIDIIVVQVSDPDEIEEVADRIEKSIRKDRGLKEGEEDFSVETPLDAISTVNSILGSVNVVVIGIAMISLIVGGIGIANTMYTSVLERKQEIGTMKAVGAKNSDILLIFLIESGLLGLVGGAIGVFIGLSLAFGAAELANNYFGQSIISVIISLPLIISVTTFSFLIGVFSGLVPSYQASKLKPVEALRG